MIEQVRSQGSTGLQESDDLKKTTMMKRTLEMTKERALMLAERSTQVVISCLSSILTLVLVLAVAIFVYATFYYAYMPLDMFKIPVNLEFEPCSNGSSSARCSDLSGKIPLGRGRQLLQGQAYIFNMKMTVPDNEVNEMEGMFMMCLTVSSSTGVLVDRSCRSSIIQYRSHLLRFMETLTFSPALLLGFSSQQQEVEVNFFNDFRTDPHIPAELLTLEIQSRQLQVSEVSIEILAELRGLRQLMYQHPWVSAIFGVSSNILILMMIIVVSWSRFLSQKALTQEAEEEGNQEEDNTRLEEERPLQSLESRPAAAELPTPPRTGFGRSLLKALIKLCFLTVVAMTCWTAYQHEVYEPSKLVEIVTSDLKSFIMSTTESNFLQNLWTLDDIFMKLFVVKIVAVIMIIIIMNTTRFID